MFFPIFWMMLDRLQDRDRRDRHRPSSFFSPTLENYAAVRERADYFALCAEQHRRSPSAPRILALLIAVPGAYAMAFFPSEAHQRRADVDALDQDDAGGRRARADLSARPRTSACSTPVSGLITVYTLMNLPIVVWMLYTFFKEVPKDILEAGRMDGAARAGDLASC